MNGYWRERPVYKSKCTFFDLLTTQLIINHLSCPCHNELPNQLACYSNSIKTGSNKFHCESSWLICRKNKLVCLGNSNSCSSTCLPRFIQTSTTAPLDNGSLLKMHLVSIGKNIHWIYRQRDYQVGYDPIAVVATRKSFAKLRIKKIAHLMEKKKCVAELWTHCTASNNHMIILQLLQSLEAWLGRKKDKTRQNNIIIASSCTI